METFKFNIFPHLSSVMYAGQYGVDTCTDFNFDCDFAGCAMAFGIDVANKFGVPDVAILAQ